MVFVGIKISDMFKLLILKIEKTDMRNIKYTLKLFIGVAGNTCKKMIWKSWNSKTTDNRH